MIRDYEHEKGIEKDARRAEERDRKARQDEPIVFFHRFCGDCQAEFTMPSPIPYCESCQQARLTRPLPPSVDPPVLALCAKCLTLTASVGRLCAPCAKALAIDCNNNLERDEYPWPDPRRDDDECDDFVGDAR